MLLTLDPVQDWHFVNQPWRDGPDKALEVPEQALATDGAAMQGVHYAFYRKQAFGDCTIQLEFLQRPHSDIGIVLRASDESNFQLLHFPCCGQACRAQHFWAALSVMDRDGYLRARKRQLVQRVPSTAGKWIKASVEVKGDSLRARICDYGSFEATLAGNAAGHIGLFQFGPAKVRNVRIDGGQTATAAQVWKSDAPRPRKNWAHPIPADAGAWQQPVDVKRLPDGQLLMLFNHKHDQDQGETAQARPMLSRSRDGGRTWSTPAPFGNAGEVSAWFAPRIHVTPRGRLIALLPDKPGGAICESHDAGATWSSEPVKTNLPLDRLSLPPSGMMNLADGSIIVFPYSRHSEPVSENIWTWGSFHCHAFACRSEDDGRTWNEPVNLDMPMVDAKGKVVYGNLDLTEASAAQLPGGRVMAFVRPIYSPWMWETWSDDGGRSWGACVRGPFPGYASPNMVRTASGTLLIARRLPELTINVSHDDGVTWDHGTIIDTGIWAMGSMVEVEPDVVFYVYWDSFGRAMRCQHMRVSRDRGLAPHPTAEW